MFSVRQKREIAEKVQKVLRETGHPELPAGEIRFLPRRTGGEEVNTDPFYQKGTAREINDRLIAEDTALKTVLLKLDSVRSLLLDEIVAEGGIPGAVIWDLNDSIKQLSAVVDGRANKIRRDEFEEKMAKAPIDYMTVSPMEESLLRQTRPDLFTTDVTVARLLRERDELTTKLQSRELSIELLNEQLERMRAELPPETGARVTRETLTGDNELDFSHNPTRWDIARLQERIKSLESQMLTTRGRLDPGSVVDRVKDLENKVSGEGSAIWRELENLREFGDKMAFRDPNLKPLSERVAALEFAGKDTQSRVLTLEAQEGAYQVELNVLVDRFVRIEKRLKALEKKP